MEITDVEIESINKAADGAGIINIAWWGKGWGHIYFILRNSGILQIDSELMSPEFVKQVLCKLVDDVAAKGNLK